MHKSHTSHPEQGLLLSPTTRIYQMHKKTQLVPGITTKACHVLWLLEILHHDLHRSCLCVPLRGQGISSSIPYLSRQFQAVGVEHLPLFPSSVLEN